MSIAKVIEVIAEGSTVETAVANGVAEASKTVKNIRSVYLQDTQALVTDNQVTAYRVNCKITFIVD